MATRKSPRRKCKGFKTETPKLDYSLSDAFKIYPELSTNKPQSVSWPIPGGNARPILDYSPVKITPISKQEMFQRYLEYYGIQQIFSNVVQKLYLDDIRSQHFEEVFLQAWRSFLDVGKVIEENELAVYDLKQRTAKLNLKKIRLEKLEKKEAQKLKRQQEKEAKEAKLKPTPKIDIPVSAGDAKSTAKSDTLTPAVPEHSVKSKDNKKQVKQARTVSAKSNKKNIRNSPRPATS